MDRRTLLAFVLSFIVLVGFAALTSRLSGPRPVALPEPTPAATAPADSVDAAGAAVAASPAAPRRPRRWRRRAASLPTRRPAAVRAGRRRAAARGDRSL